MIKFNLTCKHDSCFFLIQLNYYDISYAVYFLHFYMQLGSELTSTLFILCSRQTISSFLIQFTNKLDFNIANEHELKLRKKVHKKYDIRFTENANRDLNLR